MNKITKRMSVNCNELYLESVGGITCTLLGDDVESAQRELILPVDNYVLGEAIKTCLENSKELTNDEWDAIYGTNDNEFYKSMQEKMEARSASQIEKYGYKSEKAMYKNMMSCPIFVYDDSVIDICPWRHIKLTVWEGMDTEIKVRYDTPIEILGAVVRYAFTKCQGKGPYAKGVEIVTNVLFPNEVPASLEEYLESIDQNYDKWLIKE